MPEAARQMRLRLWSPDDEPPPETLTAAFERVGPELLRHAAPTTRENYRHALQWWTRATGDPPLEHIDRPQLDELPEQLAAAGLAPGTVRKHCASLSRLLRRLDLPAIRPPPPPPLEVSGDYTRQEVAQLLAAAAVMRAPRLPQSPPPRHYWRALIAVAYFHGFRTETLLGLRWSHIIGEEWQLPAAILKGKRRGYRAPLHPQLPELLAEIEAPARDRIFPWHETPHARRGFYRAWRRLATAAGIPPERRFAIHGIRKAHATAVAETNPEHARLSLGHSLFRTTAAHYIGARAAAPTLAQLELPQ